MLNMPLSEQQLKSVCAVLADTNRGLTKTELTHTLQHSDWDEDWVFYDSRFGIKSVSDDEWLKFLCETFHPAVRDEKRSWQHLLVLINWLLMVDGFELYEDSHISGRPKYSWRKATGKNTVAETQSKVLAQKFNSEYINSQIKFYSKSETKSAFSILQILKPS